MLDVKITIEGDRVLIEGLNKFAQEMPGAVQRGIGRAGSGIYEEAFKWLSGAGGESKKKRRDYVGFTKKSGEKVTFRSYVDSGRYPVPVRSGNLRGHLNWLFPGQTKSGKYGTFSAGPFESIVYDSVPYANVIHEGRGSSAKFGPRRFLTDALERFNQGARIMTIIEEEIQKKIKEAGL